MSITLFDVFRQASTFEKSALIAVLVVAVLGLIYAAFLARQILREPEGTDKMKHIAKAIRDGGNAYLKRQFKTIALLIVILAIFVFATGWFATACQAVPPLVLQYRLVSVVETAA